MDLHRSSSMPDWASVPESKKNKWQRLAATTNGVVTPPNVITMIGFAVVLFGLCEILLQHFWLGGLSLGFGRLLDIADGLVAEYTSTKSPLGELLDATIDKIGTFLTMIVFFIASIAPRPLLILLLLPQVVISAISLAATHRHIRLHPSRTGKLSMASMWVSLVGYVFVRGLHPSSAHVLSWIVGALAVVSIAIGIYTAAGYARDFKSAVLSNRSASRHN